MLVPADSPEDLASAITEFLDDPAEAQLAGHRGQSEIRARFDLDVEADLLARSTAPGGSSECRRSPGG